MTSATRRFLPVAALVGGRQAHGRFTFLAIPAASYSVAFRHIGFAPLRMTEV